MECKGGAPIPGRVERHRTASHHVQCNELPIQNRERPLRNSATHIRRKRKNGRTGRGIRKQQGQVEIQDCVLQARMEIDVFVAALQFLGAHDLEKDRESNGEKDRHEEQ